MALVVFLRGVNVGGHRAFRPSVLARELGAYDVVNVGAAGTFVVGRPGGRAALRAELRRRLPFETDVVLCEGANLLQLEADAPFGATPARRDVVRFVSILAKPPPAVALPLVLPSRGRWLVKVLGAKGRFAFGTYRREMKTIGCLGELDALLGAPATTRGWTTILAVARILRERPR